MEEKNTPRRPRRNTDEQPKAAKNESLVYGKNPVTELLKSGSGVDTVLLAEGMAPAVAAYYTAMAKEVGAAVKRVNPNKLRLMTGTDSHQGVAAFASEIEYVTVEDLTGNCSSFLVVRPWTQFFKPEKRDDMPLSTCNNITIRNIKMDCKNFFDVGKSDKYRLKDFTFEDCDITDQKKAFDKTLIENCVVDGLKVNGEEIK